MVKAELRRPDGTLVVVDGSPEEVERTVRLLTDRDPAGPTASRAKPRKSPAAARPAIKDYVLELHESGFFKEPRGLSEIKDALGAEGHPVPVTTLSGVMFRLVQAKELRRIREKNAWKYARR